MATEMLQYLDPDGLDETVLNIGQIKTILEGQISDLGESIEEELQDLPYARPDGIYPDMTVGAVIGADETAQWATRESTGSGAATVRSVQGATVAFAQMVQKLPDNAQAFNVIAGVGGDTTTITQYGDGFVTFASSNVYSGIYFKHQNVLMLRKNHIYLGLWDVETNTAAVARLAFGTYSGSSVAVQAGDRQRVFSTIQHVNDDALTSVSFQMYRSQAPTSAVETTYSNCMLFDLTQMFGAGNEPTAEQFMRMFPATYYQQALTPTLKPVRIAGIASTDANGYALDGVEWETQTLRAAGSVRDELTAGELVTRVGVVVIDGVNVKAYGTYPISGVTHGLVDMGAGSMLGIMSQVIISCDKLPAMSGNQEWTATLGIGIDSDRFIRFVTPEIAEATSAADLNAWLQQNPLTCFYAIATPTTTPISPALPMTYRVQQGGTESIVVPEGEMSAAPVITIAEPVNAGDEFARIWAAIESLGYTRNTAQLSRPISLTDVGSVDETQKDTTEIAEIETTKEVQE